MYLYAHLGATRFSISPSVRSPSTPSYQYAPAGICGHLQAPPGGYIYVVPSDADGTWHNYGGVFPADFNVTLVYQVPPSYKQKKLWAGLLSALKRVNGSLHLDKIARGGAPLPLGTIVSVPCVVRGASVSGVSNALGSPSRLDGLAESWNEDMNRLLKGLCSFQKLSSADQKTSYDHINWIAQVIAHAIDGDFRPLRTHDLGSTRDALLTELTSNTFFTNSRYTQPDMDALVRGIETVIKYAIWERDAVQDPLHPSRTIQTLDDTNRLFRDEMYRLGQSSVCKAPVPNAPIPVSGCPTGYSLDASGKCAPSNIVVRKIQRADTSQIPGGRINVTPVQAAPCPVAGQIRDARGNCVSVGFAAPAQRVTYGLGPAATRTTFSFSPTKA